MKDIEKRETGTLEKISSDTIKITGTMMGSTAGAITGGTTGAAVGAILGPVGAGVSS